MRIEGRPCTGTGFKLLLTRCNLTSRSESFFQTAAQRLTARDHPPSRSTSRPTGAARDIIIKSSLGFGEAYTRGEVDVEGDLQAVALMSYELQERLLKGSLWERARYMLGFFARRNTLSGSKKNIAAHYDLANGFYQLWLDAEMQYTCAYFNRPTDTLEDAQTQRWIWYAAS